MATPSSKEQPPPKPKEVNPPIIPSKDTPTPSSKEQPPPKPKDTEPLPLPPAPIVKPPVIPDPPVASLFLTPMKIYNWLAGFPLTGNLKSLVDQTFTKAYKLPLQEFNDYPGVRGDVGGIRKKMEQNMERAAPLREKFINESKSVFTYDAKGNLVTRIDPYYLDLFTELGYMNALNMALDHLMEEALVPPPPPPPIPPVPLPDPTPPSPIEPPPVEPPVGPPEPSTDSSSSPSAAPILIIGGLVLLVGLVVYLNNV